MTPHHFECKDATEGNMIPKQKWSHMTWDILGKTHMTSDRDLCDLCPKLTFNELFPTVTQYHKTAHTVSPYELGQISLPQASMAPSATFHDPCCHG